MRATRTTRERVAELELRPPVFSPGQATLRQVARTLWAEGVGVLLVGEPDEPVGIISERDVVARLAAGADPDSTTAAQAMTEAVICAGPDDLLFEVAGQMLDNAVRHVPVTDGTDRISGVVSMRDLLRPLLLDAASNDRAT
ncbi:MAG TPA: CBS domain-containing protein [Acidimicrobiales bacterium]|nr:CBS domain-containing protein [Acidimicrobiales bacterium]